MESTRCPFGCDVPWPHEPGACITHVDAATYEAITIPSNPPRGPTPAMQEAAKRHAARLKLLDDARTG